MADDGKVVIELVGKDNATQAFIQSIRGMEDSIKRLEASGQGLSSLGGVFNTLQSHWMAFVGAFGGGYLITKGLRDMAESFKTITEADLSLEHLAERLGTSAAEMAGLQYAAKRSGVDVEAFNASITRMEKNISTAALSTESDKKAVDDFGDSGNKAAQALRELGLKAEVMVKMSPKDQLLAMATAMQRVPVEADKVRIVLDLMGKGAGGMVTELKKGPEAIDVLYERYQKLTGLTDDMVKRGAESARAAEELGTAWHGFAMQATDVVAPSITAILKGLLELKDRAKDTGPPVTELMRQMQSGQQPSVFEMIVGTAATKVTDLGGALNSFPMPTLKEIVTLLAAFPFLTPALGPLAFLMEGGPPAPITSSKGRLTGMGQGPYTIPEQYRPNFPPDLLTDPTRKKPEGPGKGGADSEAARLASLYDGLMKDIAKLSEGSLSEIEANLQRTIDQIYKKIETRVTTEAELEVLARQRAGLQKQKAEEDFQLFVAKESGNMYAAIEAEAKAWLDKYKGFAGAEENIAAIKNRRIWEEDIKNSEKRLTMTKTVLDALAQESPFLSQQLDWKAKILPLEIELNRLALERMIFDNKISEAGADQLRSLQALGAQYKRNALEREQWQTQGVTGGIKGYLAETQKAGETAGYDETINALKGMKSYLGDTLGGTIADGIFKKGKLDFQRLGEEAATSIIKKLATGGTNKLFDAGVKGVADFLGLGSGGPGGKPTGSVASPFYVIPVGGKGLGGLSGGEEDISSAFSSNYQSLGEEFGNSANSISEDLANLGTSFMEFTGLAGEAASAAPGWISALESIVSVILSFLHEGGVVAHHGLIVAHAGLAADERLVLAQVGEPIFNREAWRQIEGVYGPGAFDMFNSGRVPMLPLPVPAGVSGGEVHHHYPVHINGLQIDARGASKDIDWGHVTRRQIVPEIQKLIDHNMIRFPKRG